MNYLFVVAHPDDEVLGAGATIYRLVQEGHKVAVCTMVNQASARAGLSSTLHNDQSKAFSMIGVQKHYPGDFPNIKMNTVPHIDLVQFIEQAIKDWKADAIITHHPSDVNVDHQETSKAAIAACRLFQRTSEIPPLRLFAYMEVPSSTEWSLNVAENRFQPNLFFEVGKEGIERKIRALQEYKGVMRPYPHPRSTEALTGLAAARGAQAGCDYAEAFESVFCVNKAVK